MAPDPRYTGPDLCAMSARAVVDLLRSRQVSPAELVEASLTRLSQVEPAVNATPTICADRAREAARADHSATLLAGLPIGIKDLTPVAGVRTTFGTRAMADFVPKASDPLVTRLEDRGGIVMGKTNTPEMGAGGNTFNDVFGPTRNPWNTALNAGGSSGGAAASLATGEVWLSHGSDYGGSLRTPANYCGIVGMRPSPGVAGGGSASMGFEREGSDGPMARDVLDCALFLDAMAGFDPRWPISWPAPQLPYATTAAQDAGGFRIGYAPDLGGFAVVTPEIDGILRAALVRIEAGNRTVDETCPDLTGLNETFRALRALAQIGVPGSLPDSVQQHYKDTLRINIETARNLSFSDYVTAQKTRSALYDRMLGYFATHEVLACPVNGVRPLPVEVEYPIEVNGQPMGDYLDWLRFSFLATTLGLPAISLPVGFSEDGLPVGLQLIGQPRGEARLLQIAHAIEQELNLTLGPIDPRKG
ncbi:amidase family protein [Mesobacterium sp. TK19101]|uniref:Amidase family protein n=1 Tax=Mesobacterium hydrothermale TaxID=3111907 RepID=A0ABU6HLM7_9RHOB|nr:amidase family protein [Mesobacterium sp. TK19101]MEC3863272.1 amidase family protein [Mesobacterium sp. TK19101]